MDRYICIHGHFYQPPRENPWLEAVETQASAYPYHDWNARIAAECYAANGAARILDGAGKIADITNNYAHISFNVGPTLLTWMAENDPETYQMILEADQQSQERFGGHGSALAQVYNHLIMPLANRRDKVTQVRWGIRDFVARFGRQPEGMWLAETAVDIETLEVLAEHGITFTILAPNQARQVRPLGGEVWTDVTNSQIDPTRAYRQLLPSGRSIDLFFYDGPISRAIAFERLLSSGETFAQRLAGAFDDGREWSQLVHIATDGETYGHHFRHGEMGLAYALRYIEDQHIAHLTNYGQYLEKVPPTMEVQILEDTSWSCAHGVERWRSDCGCNSGGYPQWNQQWRAPLRAALDWLRDAVNPLFETQAATLFADPWAARDEYIEVILNRGEAHVRAILARLAGRDLSEGEVSHALRLLELQRNALLMFTSCGWFFDELSGIETVQVIEYAGRVAQLASELGEPELEATFLERLADARSNIATPGNGRAIYEAWIRPAMVSLRKVTAHYAMSDLFEQYAEQDSIYCYNVTRQDHRMLSAGRARLVLGTATVRSRITHESGHFIFTALHFDNHNLTGGVRDMGAEDGYEELAGELTAAFDRADLAETVRLLDKLFERGLYTVNLLFRDEQIKILDIISRDEREEAESLNTQIYDRNVALLRFLAGLGLAVPDTLRFAAETALKARLRRAIGAPELNADEVRQLIHEAESGKIQLDTAEMAYQMQLRLESLMEAAHAAPTDLDGLRRATTAAELTQTLPVEIDTWRAQNLAFDMARHHLAEQRERAGQHDPTAEQWLACFIPLAQSLWLRV